MNVQTILAVSVYASFAMVMASLVIAFVRMARGPSLADRVVALDMMTVSIIAVCGVAAVATGVYALLDVALVLALVGFLATVALARYAERSAMRREENDRV